MGLLSADALDPNESNWELRDLLGCCNLIEKPDVVGFVIVAKDDDAHIIIITNIIIKIIIINNIISFTIMINDHHDRNIKAMTIIMFRKE